MSSFDNFSALLWEEAKRFYEKAKDSREENAKTAFLHSSILIGMSALEAYVNNICDELCAFQDIPLHEKSLLKEREIEFDTGEFKLSESKLQIHRLTDRIEFLFFKFGSIKLSGSSYAWYGQLKVSIKLRNGLVHPREEVRVTEDNTKLLLESINECLEDLSKCVYKKSFPITALNLQSKLQF